VELAAEATDLPVTEFRAAYLAGTLLAAEDVARWVEERSAHEGPPSWWLNDVPVERLQPVGREGEGGYLIPPDVMASVPRTTHYLWYATPEQDCTDVAVRLGGVLDMLRHLAEELLELNPDWEPPPPPFPTPEEIETSHLQGLARAATFVLTGYAPLIDERSFPLPEGTGRRQTTKHLQLAAFTATRERVEGVPLAARLAEWNARYPQWRYANTSSFGRDSRDGERRLKERVGPVSKEDLLAAAMANLRPAGPGWSVAGGWTEAVARPRRRSRPRRRQDQEVADDAESDE
jgi:hypothetical protein